MSKSDRSGPAKLPPALMHSPPRSARHSFVVPALFVRFFVPQKHTEAKRGRRWFLLIAARLVPSGRQKELQVPISGGWAEQLRDGVLRLHDQDPLHYTGKPVRT